MFAWVHRRVREDEGISLVEVLVSVMLIGLVLLGLGSTLFSSMASARQNESLTQATSVANEELERLVAAPWGSLNPAAAPVTSTVTRGNRQYVVTRDATWVEAPRYMQLSVDLQWTENGRVHNIVVEGRRLRQVGEAGLGSGSPDPFQIKVFTVNPDPVNLDSSSRTLPSTNPTLPGNDAMMLEVETSEPAQTGSVIARWPAASPTQSLTLTEVPGSGGLKWTGTVDSGQTYPSGWLDFVASATKSGAPATTATQQTSAYLLAPVGLNALYYDDRDQRQYGGTPGSGWGEDKLCATGNPRRLRNDNPFYANLRGLGVDDSVTLVRTDVAGVSFPMTYWSGWWSATATSAGSGNMPNQGTNTTWELRWTRSYDGLTSAIPLTFHTANANGNSAC